MRFALIDAEKAEFPVRTMCRVLDVSESGFFSWKGRPASQRQRDDMIYLAHIRIAFELSNRTYGSPRMHRDLVDEGLSIVSRTRFPWTQNWLNRSVQGGPEHDR